MNVLGRSGSGSSKSRTYAKRELAITEEAKEKAVAVLICAYL
jgi:hypothetical protein